MKIKLLSILLILIMMFTLSAGVAAEESGDQNVSSEQTSSEGTEGDNTSSTPDDTSSTDTPSSPDDTSSSPDGTSSAPDDTSSTDTPSSPDGTSSAPDDTSSTDKPTEQNGIKVEISKTEFYPDTEAQVVVSFAENSGVKNFSFEIKYDSKNLQYTGFSLDKSAFTGITVLKQNPIQIVGSTTSDTHATGTIITLKFKAKSSAEIKKPYKVEINKSNSYIYNLSDTKAKFTAEQGYAMLVCKKHTFGENEHLDPTCTEKGYDKKVCSVCGDEEITEIEAKGHSILGWQEITPSTCATQGEQQGECVNCETMVVEKLPLDEHMFSDWIETIPPTLEALGETKRVCANCSFEEIKSIPKLITGITDPESGVALLGNNGIAFYGDSAFSAKQTYFKDVDENEKARIKALVQSLIGKQPYSKFSVKFTDIDGNPIELNGTVTVSIPINSELKGVVIVGVTDSYITVLNANINGALATFTLGAIPDEFIVLYEEQEESIVKTFQNIFADDEGNVSTAGKVAGWVVMVLVAIILLGISAMLILVGVHQQKKKARLEAIEDVAESFEMEPSENNKPLESSEPKETEELTAIEPQPEIDEDYESAVRQMVEDWFNE